MWKIDRERRKNNENKVFDKLLSEDESETLEFKKSTGEWREIIETISALANTGGGIILVGISDKGEVLGLQIGKRTIEDLTNKIKENTDPKIFPTLSFENINGKNIILIEIEESKSKPVFAFGRAYKRVGKSTLRMSKDELERVIIEGKKVYWDEQICEEAKLEDIDKEKVREFLKKAGFERRLEAIPDISVGEALERLHLNKNNKLKNAPILLFGKNPQKFFLQAKLRCARYKGTTPITFIDLRIVEGNIIDQVGEAEKFVLSHIKMAAKIVGFERLEVWEYPINALREAIVNAICHRDYAYSSDITIGIFDDRIEISNPGTLPEPLTPEDLKRKHKSIPRNPLVANEFFLIRNIEQWGEGTNKIVKWCLEHGLREPDFEEIAGGFLVRFYAPDDILSLIPESGKINLEELGLNKRQIKALEIMVNKREKFTIKKYTETFEVSKKTAIRDFKELIKKEFTVKVGDKKGAYYVARENVPKR
ncbi:MAG: RNA-binding domain-containing protein [bacterium]